MKRSFLYLSEFHVGDKFITLSRTVTETDVVLFAGITGDNNPIHTDRTYAESLPLRAGLPMDFLARALPPACGAAWAWWTVPPLRALSTEWKFVGAIKIGDTIHCEVEVLEAKQSKSKPDRGVLNIQYTILNQDNQVCQVGSMATMLYWRRRKKRNEEV